VTGSGSDDDGSGGSGGSGDELEQNEGDNDGEDGMEEGGVVKRKKLKRLVRGGAMKKSTGGKINFSCFTIKYIFFNTTQMKRKEAVMMISRGVDARK
jgi:hypothetical protein